MNTEPNPPQQAAGELPSQYGQAQQSPYTSSPPAAVTPQVGPQGQKQPRRFPANIIVLLIVLAVLLIAGGGGLIYYTTVYQPNLKHAQATATAMAQLTAITRANATSTAQAFATAIVVALEQANATATAVALEQENATATAVAQANATATAFALGPIPTLPAGPTGTPVPGQWTATANGLGTFTFTVNPQSTAITEIILKSSIACGGTTIGFEQITEISSWPVSNGQFTIILPDPSVGLTITIVGKFDPSGTQASGIWQVDANGTLCPGPWTGNSGG